MFVNLAKKIFGSRQDRNIKSLLPMVQKVNQWEEKIKLLSDEQLQNQTPKFKEMLQKGAKLDDLLPEAFATVREASRRVLNMRHFDVQIMGGVVLHQGRIAEMKTGEGKTLTATLALYLNALQGRGTHLVTVNDYLAHRDGTEMGVLYNWLGLSIGVIVADLSDEQRQAAYHSDITYGTNNEFAFDYLRDNMKFNLDDYVQRDHCFCIVDEVDSILIDEARTPLLISGPSEGDTQIYYRANQVIPQLTKTTHYTVDEKSRSSVLTEEGVLRVQEILGIPNLYEVNQVNLLHALNQALKAHTLFAVDVDYVLKDDHVIIVDEFTGRLKEGSRWSDGLHQAVEAKEGVVIKSENQTLASITFQNFFRLYERLSGMTGTAETEEEEFQKIYGLDVVVIPTNLVMIRDDGPDIIFKSKGAKYRAAANLIEELHKQNRPVLVGTISIDSSERLSRLLKERNVPHEVLNAKHHEREAQIVALAGNTGQVTIATNMAGRGTDIKLIPETKKAGGLFILGTERHEARRIDNQLRGRSGRQGDPGSSKFFLSLEDDLLRIFGSGRISELMGTMGMGEDEPIEHNMITKAIARAQKKVEGHNFDIRKHLLDYDNVMNEQRKVIYTLRKSILKEDGGNQELVQEMIEDVCDYLTNSYRPEGKNGLEYWPWVEMTQGFQNTFHVQKPLQMDECIKKFGGDPLQYMTDEAKSFLKEKFSRYQTDQINMAVREILLSILDQHWKDHLLNMDHLKEGINLRAYAQQDPLNAYKRESFELFGSMKFTVKRAVVTNIFEVELYTPEEIEELRRQQEAYLQAQLEAHRRAQMAEESNKSSGSSSSSAGAAPVTRATVKVGRNEVCPCGSGKKFKYCHGV